MSFPTYLNCPFCPAQSFPTPRNKSHKDTDTCLYQCPARHAFLISEQKDTNELREDNSLDGHNSRCCN